jgi:hypothetical protein
MGQVGNLATFFGPKIRAAHVRVPGVSASQAPPLLSALYLFHSLERLELGFASTRTLVHQQLLCAVCELSNLRSVRIIGGTLQYRGLNLEASNMGMHKCAVACMHATYELMLAWTPSQRYT